MYIIENFTPVKKIESFNNTSKISLPNPINSFEKNHYFKDDKIIGIPNYSIRETFSSETKKNASENASETASENASETASDPIIGIPNYSIRETFSSKKKKTASETASETASDPTIEPAIETEIKSVSESVSETVDDTVDDTVKKKNEKVKKFNSGRSKHFIRSLIAILIFLIVIPLIFKSKSED